MLTGDIFESLENVCFVCCSVFHLHSVFVVIRGRQLVGLAARQHMMKNPANSIFGVKRFLGCTMTDEELENCGYVKVQVNC